MTRNYMICRLRDIEGYVGRLHAYGGRRQARTICMHDLEFQDQPARSNKLFQFSGSLTFDMLAPTPSQVRIMLTDR